MSFTKEVSVSSIGISGGGGYVGFGSVHDSNIDSDIIYAYDPSSESQIECIADGNIVDFLDLVEMHKSNPYTKTIFNFNKNENGSMRVWRAEFSR